MNTRMDLFSLIASSLLRSHGDLERTHEHLAVKFSPHDGGSRDEPQVLPIGATNARVVLCACLVIWNLPLGMLRRHCGT